MKRILLVAGMLAASVFVFAQSNESGTIHLNGGFALGGGSAKFKYDGGSKSGGYANFVYGLGAHYGVAEPLSVGINYKTGAYGFVIDGSDGGDGIATNVRIEARYYAVNKDNIILYLNPALGYLSLKDADFPEYKYNGLNANVGAGFGWYFGGAFGMFTELQYEINSLSLNKDANYKISTGGINWGLGLQVKI